MFFEGQSRKFRFGKNLTKIAGTLREDVSSFMIISRRILMRMRNISDKLCTGNQNTYFVFSNNFSRKSRHLIDEAIGDSVIRRMRSAR